MLARASVSDGGVEMNIIVQSIRDTQPFSIGDDVHVCVDESDVDAVRGKMDGVDRTVRELTRRIENAIRTLSKQIPPEIKSKYPDSGELGWCQHAIANALIDLGVNRRKQRGLK